VSEKNESALVVLEEVLLAARRAAERAQQEPTPFNSGLKAAYYDVLTVALEQAAALDLDPKEFGLADYDPDTLLRKDQAA
jgi:hypothetical protein